MTLRPHLLCVALLLAACGSPSTPSGQDAPAPKTEAAPQTLPASAPPAEKAAAEKVTAAPAKAPTAPPGAAAPTGTNPGQAPPDFDLPVLSGGSADRVSLSALRGKVVLMTFWASWCGPCRMEVPALEKDWKELRDSDAVVLGISIDDTLPAAESFLKMFPVSYPMAFDKGGRSVADVWGVQSIPATIVIDKRGVVRKRHLGYSPTMLSNTVKLVRELEQE